MANELEKLLSLCNEETFDIRASFFKRLGNFFKLNSYYQKLNYLSDLLIAAFKEEPKWHWNCDGVKEYSHREHLLACLASDILTMDLWSHPSFKLVVHETLVKAILVDCDFNSMTFRTRTDQYKAQGIEWQEAQLLIANYIRWNRPKEDTLVGLFENRVTEKPRVKRVKWAG